jgi:hypothetical protein
VLFRSEEFEVKEDRKLSEIDFIKEGIKYMPPNYVVETYFLNMLGQYDQIIDKNLKIKVDYKNSEGKNISETIKINMSQYKGRQKLGEDPINTIAKNVKKLEEDMNKLVTKYCSK